MVASAASSVGGRPALSWRSRRARRAVATRSRAASRAVSAASVTQLVYQGNYLWQPVSVLEERRGGGGPGPVGGDLGPFGVTERGGIGGQPPTLRCLEAIAL